MNRPLTKSQSAVLAELRARGEWRRTKRLRWDRWVWDNDATPIRVLDALVRRGLATKTNDECGLPVWRPL